MKHVTVTGTYFECGVQVGRQFRKEIQWRLLHHGIDSAAILKHAKAFELMKKKVFDLYPAYCEEIFGLSVGSGIDINLIYFLNFAELSQYHHGCSSIATVSGIGLKKKMELVHNEDGDADEKKSACALVTYHLPSGSFTAFTYLGELPGNSFSWNAKGLFFTVNYIQVRPLSRQVPRYFVSRSLLECSSIRGVKKELEKVHCDSAFHYFVGDSSGVTSFEHCYDGVSPVKVSSRMVHTNHLLRGKVRSEIYGSTLERYTRASELLGSNSGLKILFDTTNRPKPLYAQKGDVSRTLATVRFLPLQGKVEIYENRLSKMALVLKIK